MITSKDNHQEQVQLLIEELCCAESNTLQSTDSSVYFFVLTTNIKYYCYRSTILSFDTFTETQCLIGETLSCYLSFLFFHHFSEQFVFLPKLPKGE